MKVGVWGVGVGVWMLGFRVWSLGFVDVGFGVWGLEYEVLAVLCLGVCRIRVCDVWYERCCL